MFGYRNFARLACLRVAFISVLIVTFSRTTAHVASLVVFFVIIPVRVVNAHCTPPAHTFPTPAL